MIKLIKAFMPDAPFWIMAGAVAFFFGWAMNAQYDAGKARKSAQKAKTELAIMSAQHTALQNAVKLQNDAITTLHNRTDATLTRLNTALDDAQTIKKAAEITITSIESLPESQSCEEIRERMIAHARR
jgi:hypothetical protein